MRLLAIPAAIVLVVLGLGQPAAAHGTLAYADPAHQSTLTTARPQLALYFTERPAPNAFFSIIAPTGLRVDQGWTHGEPKRLDKPVEEMVLRDGQWQSQLYHAGFPAMVNVSHWPGKGVYTVIYESTASDGDKVKGEVRFDYQGPATAAPAGWVTPTNAPQQAQADTAVVTATTTATSAISPPPATPNGLSWWVWLGAGVVICALAIALVRYV